MDEKFKINLAMAIVCSLFLGVITMLVTDGLDTALIIASITYWGMLQKK